MFVQPFQMGIISQQSSIVKLILEYLLKEKNPHDQVLKVIEARIGFR